MSRLPRIYHRSRVDREHCWYVSPSPLARFHRLEMCPFRPFPGLSRAGVLKGGPEVSAAVRAAETSGKALGIRLLIESVFRVEDFGPAFSALRAGRAQGALVLRSRFMGIHRKTVADLALKNRIPTISEFSTFAMLGGLLSYGYDLRELYRLLAETVDTILRGTPVSEVPIRQVTTFQLIINLKTAKALGLTIPP